MGRQIKRPQLEATSPPFFDLDVGHSAKLFAVGEAFWVKVLQIEGDDLLGELTTGGPDPDNLRTSDVIEFKRCHIFGLF